MRKKIINSLGSLVALLALAFVAQQLIENWQQAGSFNIDLQTLGLLIIGAFAYAGACLLLSRAWLRLLAALTPVVLSRNALRAIYARSQIAKYIPGNVMQIAGRHVMIRKLGVAHKALAFATILEILGLLSAACSFAIIAGLLYGLWGQYIDYRQLYYILSGAVGLLLLLPIFIKILMRLYPAGRPFFTKSGLQYALLSAYGYYCCFFSLTGCLLLALVLQINGSVDTNDIAAIIASFSISWLAGFLTPGAPSGIGIRESILIMTLNKILPGSNGVIIAVLFRLITTGGDVLFFFLAGKRRNLQNKKV